jgi:outer membrane protein assembly factor BamB
MRKLLLLALPLALLWGVSQAQSPVLEFSDLEGWWSADPSFAGETSRVALHFETVDGKPVAKLSLPAIAVFDVSLGVVTISGNRLDTQPLSFPLTYDANQKTLRGVLPKDAVPVYPIAVEFKRGQPLPKPAPPTWKAPQPTRLWSVETGSPVSAALARDPASGLLLVGTDAGVLHAIAEDGSPRWKYSAGGAIRAEPAIIQRHVYVSADSGFTAKLDIATGREAWRVRTDQVSAPRLPATDGNTRWDRYGSGIVAAGKRLYLASRDQNLYALDRETGATLWKYPASDIMTATPALYRDLVLIADYAGKVQAVNATDGKLRWSYDAKLAVPGDLVVDGDQVLVGSRSYELIALDAASGRERWKHYYWFSWIESPPVVRDGVIYTGSSDATKVYAIDAQDGQLRWKTDVPGWAWPRPAVSDRLVIAAVSGSGAYPGFRAGARVALDRASGAIRWMHLEPPSQRVIDAGQSWGYAAAPVISGATVYAADLTGKVSAFELE